MVFRGVAQQANILIMIRSRFVLFAGTPYLEPWQHFQNILTGYWSTMLRQKKGFGSRISKYQKAHNHSAGWITQQHFLTYLRPGRRRTGEMVLPGSIWQEISKVDKADMSPSAPSSVTHSEPQTFVLKSLTVPACLRRLAAFVRVALVSTKCIL